MDSAYRYRINSWIHLPEWLLGFGALDLTFNVRYSDHTYDEIQPRLEGLLAMDGPTSLRKETGMGWKELLATRNRTFL